ncbi:MAG: hypothetical protein O3B75_07710 [Planctomycetota bacterium]|nr:hypothetical protein [Planctomycetota bacterium]
MKIDQAELRAIAFEKRCAKSLILLRRCTFAVKQAQLARRLNYRRGDER